MDRMSDASARGDPPVQSTDLGTLHRGDTARVISEEQVLDPAAVIAVWPWYQADFDDGSHSEDMTPGETKSRGTRATFATEDGGRYAAVDWTKTDDAAVLYLLVIDSEDPDGRRWDRVGRVQRVERYGEPEDRTPEWFGRPPSRDIPPWTVEQNADPEFTIPGGHGDE
jgi:hypothetical protein